MNKELVKIENDEIITYSSTIADGTNVQHKNVLELVRTYINDLEEFGRVAFETQSFETSGGSQKREVALLNERQATLIMTYMRNSEIVREFKKRLVKAFYELSQNQNKSITDLSRLEILEIAIASEKERLQLAQIVEEQKPKVEAYETFINTDDSVDLKSFANTAYRQLRLGRNKLFSILRERGYLSLKNLPYQKYISQGLFVVKQVSYENKSRIYCQTRITPKGQVSLLKVLRNE